MLPLILTVKYNYFKYILKITNHIENKREIYCLKQFQIMNRILFKISDVLNILIG